MDIIPDSQLSILRIKEVITLTGLSRSTIYDKLNPKSSRFDPSFPKSIKLSLRAVGWLKADIELWINSKVSKI